MVDWGRYECLCGVTARSRNGEAVMVPEVFHILECQRPLENGLGAAVMFLES